MAESMLIPSLEDVQELFTQQVASMGGCVRDAIVHSGCFFGRAKFPHTIDVKPRDTIEKGVAIRTFEKNVFVHPYTLRRLCVNGSIAPYVWNIGHIERVDASSSEIDVRQRADSIVQAIEASANDAVFKKQVRQMRDLANHDAELKTVLRLLKQTSVNPNDIVQSLKPGSAASKADVPSRGRSQESRQRRRQSIKARQKEQEDAEMRRRFPQTKARGESLPGRPHPFSDPQTVERIVQQFEREDDSLFGVMNALTAVARETEDAFLKWELEQLGGSLLGAVPLAEKHPESIAQSREFPDAEELHRV